jgi:4a-hydroxytetrahydrobiopterin dehydratase
MSAKGRPEREGPPERDYRSAQQEGGAMTADDTFAGLAALPIRTGAPRLADGTLGEHLAALPGWTRDQDRLVKSFAFDDYPMTVLFANAVALLAQRIDHHPDIEIGYRRCRVAWTTHDAGGITENDCIAAARTEVLAA